MTAKILDGNALAKMLREQFARRVSVLTAKGRQPGLAVVLVGDNPASQVYVRNKVSACEATGIYSNMSVFSQDVDPKAVLERIAELNADARVHGILVQLPLPAQFDEQMILEAIDPEKDVDGFHATNIGALTQGNPRFIPCTPYGIMKMIEHAGVPISGKHAVIVGRSNIVGKPMALLLLSRNATVTICHSRTSDLSLHTRRADILIAAVGKPRFINGEMIKPGALVVDVGINRLPDSEGGKLCGDVDFASCKEVASFITPVPGGVGPMTITMLLANTIQVADRAEG